MAYEAVSTAALVRFNPMDPQFVRNPYPVYARLRREAPYLVTKGTRILTRYKDVQVALKDRRFSVGLIPDVIARNARVQNVDGMEQVDRFIRNSIVFTDNPEHARLRRLVNQAYTNAIVHGLMPLIDSEVNRCLDQYELCEQDDVIQRLAQPLPVDVLCAWLGVSRDRRDDIARHIHFICYLLDPGLMTPAHYNRVAASLSTLTSFFMAHAHDPRRRTGDTLLDFLRDAQSDGDRLDDEEVAFACIMSFVAGTETTQCLIGNLIWALSQNPTQFALLRSAPGCISQAVEEAVRLETPLQLTKRVALEPTEINGQAIANGEQILLCLGSANRDETVFEDPDRFDARQSRPPHVGFGAGMHGCLGGYLARLQAERCLTAILERYTELHPAPNFLKWQSDSLILRGLTRLPVRMTGPRRPQTTASLESADV